jgi:Helix-turn-helix.
MINVGERIRQLRKAKNITSTALAQQLGVTQSFISGIETNRKKCSLETLDTICSLLDVSLAEFFQESTSELEATQKELLEAAKNLTPDQRGLLKSFLQSLK